MRLSSLDGTVGKTSFPPKTAVAIYQHLGQSVLFELATKVLNSHLFLHAGWPDLTVAGQLGISLIEVKGQIGGKDRIHYSQIFVFEQLKELFDDKLRVTCVG